MYAFYLLMIEQWQSKGWNCTDFWQILTMCQCISSSTRCSMREKRFCLWEITIFWGSLRQQYTGWLLRSTVTPKSRQFSGQIHTHTHKHPFDLVHPSFTWFMTKTVIAHEQFPFLEIPFGTSPACSRTFPILFPRWPSISLMVPLNASCRDCQQQGGRPGSSEHVTSVIACK